MLLRCVLGVKILGGSMKGQTIEIPSKGTRPTSVILKRKFFDSLQGESKFETFLDLCAGSGSVGIEALSRGASSVTFVDKGKDQVQLIKKNCRKLNVNFEKIQIVQQDSLQWIKKNKTSLQNGVWIYFDPPYKLEGLYLDFSKFVLSLDIDINVAIEANNRLPFFSEIEELLSSGVSKVYSQGDKSIIKYKNY